MNRIIIVVIILALGSFGTLFTNAQTADTDDNQSWNDVQLTVPMTEKFDFFLVGTWRFGKDISRFNERRTGVGYVYKPSKSWSVSPFYLNIVARNSSGRFRQENRLNLRINYRFPFKKIALSHRSSFEYRLRHPQNSWRYRPALTLEKDVGKIISKSKIFITEEVFYDSLLKKISRNRFSVGINRTLTKNLSLDLYYLRQNDGFSVPGDLNVIGTSWKIKL